MLSEAQRGRAIALIRNRAEFVHLLDVVVGVAPDPDDDHVLATAVNGKARYIVTGDRRLRMVSPYRQTEIVDPTTFLHILGAM